MRGVIDTKSTVFVLVSWSVADTFSCAVTAIGNHRHSFKVLVKHSNMSLDEFWGIGRSAIETWCRRNMHSLPGDGETINIDWETLAG
jgi:hypothetical protein